jgi:predicted dehydrogenase
VNVDFHDLGHPAPGSLAGTPGIGILGSGWIVKECHLPAYADAGAEVVGIASRTAERAAELASAHGIRAFGSWEEMVEDPAVEVVDLAYPPDVQAPLIAEIVARDAGIRGILAQKPLAATLADAREAVRLCEERGVVLAVNQNMRYDHSIRALKRLLDEGMLGEPVMAQITMHAHVGWMPYAARYPRKGMLIMSVHHLDAFRFLFGEPEGIVATTRGGVDPSSGAADEMATYTLDYPGGLLAVAIDNTFSPLDQGIEWRVDGSGGTARGTVGWPDHPGGSPSTLRYVGAEHPERVIEPRWTARWFPDAFGGTMAELLGAVDSGRPPTVSGRDNLATMALLEAAYSSAASGRRVALSELEREP